MKTYFDESSHTYDGTQLRSLYTYLKFGILGDSVVAWAGPCKVNPTHMVDGEDLRAGEKIQGDSMLHFIVEVFDRDLAFMVAMQRIFASLIEEELEKIFQTNINRSGDDLFWGDGKLSISIATQSPVSSLLHFAVNLSNRGTPVKTASIEDLAMIDGKNHHLPIKDLANRFMSRFSSEYESILIATQKVKWVN
ncbi:MAG TPA: DUF366 family protein [Pseudobdellovibrionaceae bacterium]|nr:DUF366 family protein [Pseudobdellovibrionaceae bacterium]